MSRVWKQEKKKTARSKVQQRIQSRKVTRGRGSDETEEDEQKTQQELGCRNSKSNLNGKDSEWEKRCT